MPAKFFVFPLFLREWLLAGRCSVALLPLVPQKSCARCRLIVYNSVYKTFVFLLYGNNVPVATQSNDAVLQILGKFAVFGVALQLLLDVGVYRLDFFLIAKSCSDALSFISSSLKMQKSMSSSNSLSTYKA